MWVVLTQIIKQYHQSSGCSVVPAIGRLSGHGPGLTSGRSLHTNHTLRSLYDGALMIGRRQRRPTTD